jgi:tetratricopeptide (TPR) repeat protein
MQGSTDKGIECYRIAVEKDPESIETKHNFSLVLVEEGLIEEALCTLISALRSIRSRREAHNSPHPLQFAIRSLSSWCAGKRAEANGKFTLAKRFHRKSLAYDACKENGTTVDSIDCVSACSLASLLSSEGNHRSALGLYKRALPVLEATDKRFPQTKPGRCGLTVSTIRDMITTCEQKLDETVLRKQGKKGRDPR